MFDYDLTHWAAFLATALVLNLTPGPDIAFILGHTVTGGRRHGIAAMLGIWTGALCHVALAIVGLSAVIAASAIAFGVVKWAGVAYLLWIGVQALRARGHGLSAPRAGTAEAARTPIGDVFRQGVLIDLLNPKVAIFFLAFLPQFVVAGAGPIWAQLGLHGVLIIGVAAVVEPPFVLLGAALTRRIRTSSQVGRWMDRMLGTLLIALGLRLALVEQGR